MTAEDDGEPRPAVFSWKAIVAAWAVLTVAILPALAFVVLTEREVSQYSTFTFEHYVRQALEAGRFSRAVRICTGALKVGLSRSDHWGKAYLLRAKAHAGEGKIANALDDLETSARLWSRSFYFATEADRGEIAVLGTELGRRLLEADDLEGARRAVSAAGVGSGRPVEYLHEQSAALPEPLRRKLWPEEPGLLIEDYGGFEAPRFETMFDEQGRKLVASSLDAAASPRGDRCAVFDVTASSKPGSSLYGIRVCIPLSKKPFAIRTRLKLDPPQDARVTLGYWFEPARKSAATHDGASRDLEAGWRLFDIRRNFFAERAEYAKQNGYDPAEGIINRVDVSFEPGPAARCWVDRIELYIPASS